MTDPHTEPLRVDSMDGLTLPDSYIGFEGGIVARFPDGATVDCKPREWGGFFRAARPRHFGESGDKHDHLTADEIGLKRYGEPEETFKVEVADAE